MSFRFNFNQDEDDSIKPVVKQEEIRWLDCEEISPSSQLKCLDEKVRAKMFTCGELEIGHIEINEATANMTLETGSQLAKKENSDLVTGIYEGGLKIWECTNDLIEYLIENENTIQMAGKNVLDLGCGAGILGIYAFLKGAQVTFQDYNKEVLECVTIPNVLLNIEDEDKREKEINKCRFFSGDWGSFNLKLRDTDTFSIILTSETIYNEQNYEKLLKLFINKLDLNGVIYVAAKTCYFGVGGGIRQFEKCIVDSKLFDCEICWKNSHGIQREILKITKKI